jgi:hypothetical protein
LFAAMTTGEGLGPAVKRPSVFLHASFFVGRAVGFFAVWGVGCRDGLGI